MIIEFLFNLWLNLNKKISLSLRSCLANKFFTRHLKDEHDNDNRDEKYNRTDNNGKGDNDKEDIVNDIGNKVC